MPEPFFEKVRALGLDRSVAFPGFVAGEDLPAL
jgi:hypothetical protein